MTKPISIIGGGIGGLTTAITLHQRGLPIVVYESAPEIKAVGAGIIIANNAMQVFKDLGIDHHITQAGNRISDIKITDQQLKPLSLVSLAKYEQQYGVYNVAIHRGTLQQILADALGYEHIQLNKRLSSITQQNKVFSLGFDDQTHTDTHLLIGADGIKSVVRQQLFPPSYIRNAQQICWRGLCTLALATHYQHEINEAWGKGRRFGFVKINEQQVYWYALVNKKTTNSPTSEQLLNIFADFHRAIRDIIAATESSQIIENDIIDLQPIYQWQQKGVCLLGDAAHATTPNLGQGACQAIEDAYILGKLLDKGKTLEQAFPEYERLRLKKAHAVVQKSWTLGKIAHWENPFLIGLRNFVLRITPASVNQKQSDDLFDLSKYAF
jgi:2-polyprenyl-6-methoxyphenol hydroxylase-like FAD-dependent oxidoreductase